MPNYSIEARSLSIAGGVAGHDFWVLRDERGHAIAELHGLATDRETGQAIPIGTDEDRHSLRVWHYAHDATYAESIGTTVDRSTYIKDGQPTRTVLSASQEEVLERWNAAVKAAPALNALDLDYPNYGFNAFSETVNSNSAYRTLGEIMGVQVRDFNGRMEPGIDNRMVPTKQIKGFRTHGYPVLDEPRIDPLDKEEARHDPDHRPRQSVNQHSPRTGSTGDPQLDRLADALYADDDEAISRIAAEIEQSPDVQAMIQEGHRMLAEEERQQEQARQAQQQQGPVLG